MQLHLKSHSVNLNGLSVESLEALSTAARVWQRHGMSTITVTSANDGQHKTNSLHYKGDAFDLRTHYLPDPLGISNELRDELGPDYDVVLEPDHLHIEYDPEP